MMMIACLFGPSVPVPQLTSIRKRNKDESNKEPSLLMIPRLSCSRLPVRNWLGRRHASSSSSSAASPPKQRLWVRLALVSTAAAGIGAYIRSQNGASSTTLNPVTFTPYYIVSKEPVSSNGSIFTLQPPKSGEGNREVYDKAWKTGVWSVMFKQPQLQIGRDYTPLPSTSNGDDEDEDLLRFFIRRDPFGEVSRYLHGLDVGTPIEVRGPRIECNIPSNTNQVLFIAGGTGIAPALQTGHTLLRRTDETHKPKIHILWANRKREECTGGLNDTTTTTSESRGSWFSGLFRSSAAESTPVESTPVQPRERDRPSLMVQEIEALKSQYPGQVTVDYYVDEENAFIGKNTISDLTSSVRPSHGSASGKMILVSGPEGFISYMAGPKLWAQGMEMQGPLEGIIKELGLNDWAVWKL